MKSAPENDKSNPERQVPDSSNRSNQSKPYSKDTSKNDGNPDSGNGDQTGASPPVPGNELEPSFTNKPGSNSNLDRNNLPKPNVDEEPSRNLKGLNLPKTYGQPNENNLPATFNILDDIFSTFARFLDSKNRRSQPSDSSRLLKQNEIPSTRPTRSARRNDDRKSNTDSEEDSNPSKTDDQPNRYTSLVKMNIPDVIFSTLARLLDSKDRRSEPSDSPSLLEQNESSSPRPTRSARRNDDDRSSNTDFEEDSNPSRAYGQLNRNTSPIILNVPNDLFSTFAKFLSSRYSDPQKAVPSNDKDLSKNPTAVTPVREENIETNSRPRGLIRTFVKSLIRDSKLKILQQRARERKIKQLLRILGNSLSQSRSRRNTKSIFPNSSKNRLRKIRQLLTPERIQDLRRFALNNRDTLSHLVKKQTKNEYFPNLPNYVLRNRRLSNVIKTRNNENRFKTVGLNKPRVPIYTSYLSGEENEPEDKESINLQESRITGSFGRLLSKIRSSNNEKQLDAENQDDDGNQLDRQELLNARSLL
ncbi:hypothetical protein K7432_016635 [Basidiobolus ranarum]|uniref:Uncharacterized protein n=1 Tax=Basidiobolus ranarum TaxID=34480 RepID=A0ABR2WEE6_9FUNG